MFSTSYILFLHKKLIKLWLKSKFLRLRSARWDLKDNLCPLRRLLQNLYWFAIYAHHDTKPQQRLHHVDNALIFAIQNPINFIKLGSFFFYFVSKAGELICWITVLITYFYLFWLFFQGYQGNEWSPAWNKFEVNNKDIRTMSIVVLFLILNILQLRNFE